MIRIALLAGFAASLAAPAFAQSDHPASSVAPSGPSQARAAAQARSGPQAILEAVDVCDAWMTTAEDNGLDQTTPYQQTVHDAVARISRDFIDVQTHAVGEIQAYLALNGALDVWISEGHAGCPLNVASSGGRNLELNRLRPGVLALLSAEDSGWTADEDNVWVRYDGWGLFLGEDTSEPQAWSIGMVR
ncbi:hypothetical protein [Brevundimonas subvibrioides]|uniref:hypothetical protein n=1 Tax=Brevundimonas subvibrioides TaxID=74313 RepID=UPI0022B31CA4|nr:hypothetical protein [Brevundimonas subvibrioides]